MKGLIAIALGLLGALLADSCPIATFALLGFALSLTTTES